MFIERVLLVYKPNETMEKAGYLYVFARQEDIIKEWD